MRYEDAGVSDDLANRLIAWLRERYPEGKEYIGPFSAEVPLKELGDHKLLLTCDGVGTKSIVAKQFGRLKVLGLDVVAMNVNDIAAQGGIPLFFLDYLATGELKLEEAKEILKGILEGCRIAGVTLVGGETAQLPGLLNKES
jgi:phosphoribosylformylglycinamidine cyclo-ligase